MATRSGCGAATAGTGAPTSSRSGPLWGLAGCEDCARRRGHRALPEGLPDFHALLNFHALLSRDGSARACLYAFDLLLAGVRGPPRARPRRAPGLAPGAPQERPP